MTDTEDSLTTPHQEACRDEMADGTCGSSFQFLPLHVSVSHARPRNPQARNWIAFVESHLDVVVESGQPLTVSQISTRPRVSCSTFFAIPTAERPLHARHDSHSRDPLTAPGKPEEKAPMTVLRGPMSTVRNEKALAGVAQWSLSVGRLRWLVVGSRSSRTVPGRRSCGDIPD